MNSRVKGNRWAGPPEKRFARSSAAPGIWEPILPIPECGVVRVVKITNDYLPCLRAGRAYQDAGEKSQRLIHGAFHEVFLLSSWACLFSVFLVPGTIPHSPVFKRAGIRLILCIFIAHEGTRGEVVNIDEMSMAFLLRLPSCWKTRRAPLLRGAL